VTRSCAAQTRIIVAPARGRVRAADDLVLAGLVGEVIAESELRRQDSSRGRALGLALLLGLRSSHRSSVVYAQRASHQFVHRKTRGHNAMASPMGIADAMKSHT